MIDAIEQNLLREVAAKRCGDLAALGADQLSGGLVVGVSAAVTAAEMVS